jgi:hypothetical protein
MPHAIYVTNTSVAAAFRYAHPRSPDEATTLLVYDYSVPGAARVLVYERWLGSRPAKPDRIEALAYTSDLLPLYRRLAALGAANPKSVTQLHFFTHGIPERGVTGGPRGEWDRREWERVLPPGSALHRDCIGAFAANAMLKLWGCGVQPEAQRLTLSYWSTRNEKRRAAIQGRVEARIRGMYALRLSETLDQTVWAAPPGWRSSMDLPPGANYVDFWDEDCGPVVGSMWWRVSPEFVRGLGAEFYRTVLQAEIDPVGYVGINRRMSTAAPPARILEAEATAEDPAIGYRSYPESKAETYS